MIDRYFYSEDTESAFRHVIRCVPDRRHDHDQGMEWLRNLDDLPKVLNLRPEIDYTKTCLSMFAFRDEDQAVLFYMSAYNDLGAALNDPTGSLSPSL